MSVGIPEHIESQRHFAGLQCFVGAVATKLLCSDMAESLGLNGDTEYLFDVLDEENQPVFHAVSPKTPQCTYVKISPMFPLEGSPVERWQLCGSIFSPESFYIQINFDGSHGARAHTVVAVYRPPFRKYNKISELLDLSPRGMHKILSNFHLALHLSNQMPERELEYFFNGPILYRTLNESQPLAIPEAVIHPSHAALWQQPYTPAQPLSELPCSVPPAVRKSEPLKSSPAGKKGKRKPAKRQLLF